MFVMNLNWNKLNKKQVQNRAMGERTARAGVVLFNTTLWVGLDFGGTALQIKQRFVHFQTIQSDTRKFSNKSDCHLRKYKLIFRIHTRFSRNAGPPRGASSVLQQRPPIQAPPHSMLTAKYTNDTDTVVILHHIRKAIYNYR